MREPGVAESPADAWRDFSQARRRVFQLALYPGSAWGRSARFWSTRNAFTPSRVARRSRENWSRGSQYGVPSGAERRDKRRVRPALIEPVSRRYAALKGPLTRVASEDAA